jgi:hypothetical protein
MSTIESFWIVTMPAARSAVGDICFETDWVGLENQFRGGLKAEEIRAVYDNEEEAKQHAAKLIRWRQGEPKPVSQD